MKKYASLIRKLVEATAQAEAQGRDVVDILKERCFNDTSLVRQTLMNAVCDPRFKLYAGTVGFWRREARQALEQLAEQLEKIKQLTEDEANRMLENFLAAWLRMTFAGAERAAKTKTNYFQQEKEDNNNVEEALSLLNPLDDDPQPPKEASGEPNGNNVNSGTNGCKGVRTDDSDQDEQPDPEPRGIGNQPTRTANRQRLEERFLKKLPQSLVDLARRIGRMGDNGTFKAGKFMTAGKSDIVGITVGNDISAVLPSELALLAEQQTQPVFYHNFAARKLQLFASASQAKSSKKHQDGPVIICVDTSSSMSGEPIMVAKALAAAVAIIVWRKKRDVVIVKYSNTHSYRDFGHNGNNLKELSQFLSDVLMGGNNEESMFSWLFKEVKPTLPDYDTADILCISDFGWMPLPDSTIEIIEEQKQSGMKFYGLNVNAGNPIADAMFEEYHSPMEVCDSVWVYESGECKEVSPTI